MFLGCKLEWKHLCPLPHRGLASENTGIGTRQNSIICIQREWKQESALQFKHESKLWSL